MGPENIIKGRIASTIVSLMFQDANYLVINYGHENFTSYLVQLGISREGKIAKTLLATPSFILVNKKNGSVNLLQVKYQHTSASGRNIDWGYKKLQEYWSGGHLLLVRPRKPYFFLITITKKGLVALPLLDSKVFEINKNSIFKFGPLVKKFLS